VPGHAPGCQPDPSRRSFRLHRGQWHDAQPRPRRKLGRLHQDLLRFTEQEKYKSRIVSQTDIEGMLDGHVLACSAAAPGTVFLANRMGLFRSDDRGAHWHDIEVGRFSPLTYGRDLRVSPHDPNVLYAALSPAFGSGDGGIFCSDDLGKTWTRFDHGVKAEATMMAVAVHPRDPQQVVGVSKTGQVFTTGDGGDSWSGELWLLTLSPRPSRYWHQLISRRHRVAYQIQRFPNSDLSERHAISGSAPDR
jgi:hypothetical protein